MNQAISAALADEMASDPRVVVFGEDVAEAQGTFKGSEGLLSAFGPDRVRDTPISEMGFLGAAVGAAMTGLRPVVDLMFIEFLGVALDQLVTEAAMMHYLTGGKLSVPLTVRASIGSGLSFGCQHSQTLERWLLGTPGLKIVVASGAASAYSLVRAAVRDDNPVVVLEPRVLYGEREEVERGDSAIGQLGVAEVARKGSDVTVVALGQTLRIASKAAEMLSGRSVEVIDLRTLAPWDKDAVLNSVRKTGFLVTVEENQLTGGWGTEIAAHAAMKAFSFLKAPIVRVTAPDVPVPFGTELESRYLPSPEYVAAQIEHVLNTGEAPAHWWEVSN